MLGVSFCGVHCFPCKERRGRNSGIFTAAVVYSFCIAGLERLQKVIAQAGVASRRKAEELILAGRVTVNDEVMTELSYKVDEENAGSVIRRGCKSFC